MNRTIHFLLLLIICFSGQAQVNPCNRTNAGIPYSTLPGDTTVVYPNGTRLTFNRCEFFDIRNCLTITEAFSLEAVQNAGFTTQTNKGILLATAGMLKISLNPACNGRTTFEVPVKVEMPLWYPDNNCAAVDSSRFRLYTSPNGVWSDTTTIPVQKSERNGRKTIIMLITGGLNINWDVPVPTTKMKFKTKTFESINELTISSLCPLTQIKFYPQKNKRKVVARIPCINNQDAVFVSAKGYTRNGDTSSTAETPLTKLSHSPGMKNCRGRSRGAPVIRRILGIFPIRRGAVYRKYFIS